MLTDIIAVDPRLVMQISISDLPQNGLQMIAPASLYGDIALYSFSKEGRIQL
jgi:anti-sigma factor RsiW